MLYVVMVQLELLCFMEQQRDTGDIIIVPAHTLCRVLRMET